MKDRYGRPTTGLRISVTNECNLNCFYCHQEGCSGRNRDMTAGEIEKIVDVGTDFGIRDVKLTGGEPLMREDIVDVVSRISGTSIVDLSLTTNGTRLVETAKDLKEAGLKRVNVSLDSLSQESFRRITGRDKLNQVVDGIDAALNAGLTPLKINMVVLENLNEEEIFQMIDYAKKKGATLQLIELEEVLSENAEMCDEYHVDLNPIEKRIKERSSEMEVRWSMQARRKYVLDGVEVEFVNPVRNSEFCAHCTRLRVTPSGFLKPCLMRNDNLVDVLTPMRNGNNKEVRSAFETAIQRREPYFK